MAYDTKLEARIDGIIGDWDGIGKKTMFGGIGYLLHGNMAFGIWQEQLIVRVGTEKWDECLAMEHVDEFDITGRSMKGWVLVDQGAFADDETLAEWLTRGWDVAGSLHAKH